jgi:DNA-binding MarR family transcriptional regulator
MKTRNYKKYSGRYSCLLLVFLGLVLLNISSGSAVEPLEITIESASNDSNMVVINSDLYETITISVEGTSQEIVVLPSDSIAVQLPDNRIGLKFGNGTVSMLPLGSMVMYSGSNMSQGYTAVISVEDESMFFGVNKVVTLPVESFTSTAGYSQSVDALDTYRVEVVINQLSDLDVQSTIERYSVDWGDGTRDTYAADQTMPSHIYKKSGDYSQTFAVTDSFGNTYTIKQRYTVEYEGHLRHSYLWVREYKEPVAVSTSVGFSALFAGLVVLTESGKYKFLALLLLAIPLYTRISKEDVLDQFVRGQIYGYIKTNPGVHYNEIRRGIGVKNGTLSYHLRVLEKTELVKSRREGIRYRAFYPTGMKFPQQERFRMTDLQIKIMDVIQSHEGITQKEIARTLDEKPQTINYNIKVLAQAGLIEVLKQGRKTICYATVDSETSDTAAS